MRVLALTTLVVVFVIHYHGCQAVAKMTSPNLLGKTLLRRALEAMSDKSDQINIKKRSTEESGEEELKNNEALEDIFVGSGSAQEASADRRSDVAIQSGDFESGSGSESEQTSTDIADTSAQGSSELTSADDQLQEDSSGQITVSGSASAASTPSEQVSQQSEEITTPVAVNNEKVPTNEPITVVQATKDEDASKKSEIELASGEETSTKDEQEINSDGSASAEADEVTSGQATEDEHDDGSAAAIRKGMENLSRLLKPVATTLDLQVYSGSAKPKEDEDETEEQKAVIKVVAKGEGDKEDEEEKDEKEEKDEPKPPAPVKIKKCETVCKAPMTYQQCAVPRCSQKIGTIKDLCFYLCEHQKPHCRRVCKEVE